MPEAIDQNSNSQPRGEKIYNAERGKVQLAYKEFLPSTNTDVLNPEQAIVYIPGFPNDAGDASIGTIPQAFAENGNMRTFSVSTTPDSTKTSSSEEVEAILKFIKEQGLTEITLSGYSMGAARAIELASQIKKLQGTPGEIKVDGLILFSPAGVHTEGGVAKRFLSDFPKDYKQKKENDFSGAQGTRDLLKSLAGKLKFTKGRYPAVLKRDIKELATMTPGTSDIDVPVVIFTPEKDAVSKNLAPINDPKTAREVLTTAAQKAQMTPEELDERAYDVYWSRRGRAQNTKDRKAYVEENIFPNSTSVDILIPEKKPTHAGLQDFRADQATKTGLYMLNRLRRPQKQSNK